MACYCLRFLPYFLPALWLSCQVGLCVLRSGSVRFGPVRFGLARSGSARFGPVRFGLVRFLSARVWFVAVPVWLGLVWFGSVRLGSARFGSCSAYALLEAWSSQADFMQASMPSLDLWWFFNFRPDASLQATRQAPDNLEETSANSVHFFAL